MKRTVLLFLTLLLLCTALLCACAAQKPDPKAIVGNWEYWDQIWCEFNEDGTCIVGGTVGTYQVSDDMVLTMTPKNGDPAKFLWAEKKENVAQDNWFIEDGTLYLSGGVYPRVEDAAQDTQSATAAPTQATAESGASSATQATEE